MKEPHHAIQLSIATSNTTKGCNTAEVYFSNFCLETKKRIICTEVSSFPHYDFRAPHPDKLHYFIYPEAAKETVFLYFFLGWH